MDTLLHDFIQICKEQHKWEREYSKSHNYSDYSVIRQWREVPLKLVPEFDSDIMHRFSDKQCESKCTPQSNEEELWDGFCDYLCTSWIELGNNSYWYRWQWEIYLATIHDDYFTEDESDCYYVKVRKNTNPQLDAWVEFVLKD